MEKTQHHNLPKTGKHFSDMMPYEKFIRLGAEAMTDAELLAVIIRTGTPEQNAVDLGMQILHTAQTPKRGLVALNHISVKQLMEIKGIGEVKAVKLKCVAELSKRMARETAKESVCFESPGSVARYFMEEMRHEDIEKTVLVSMDAKGQLIDSVVLTTGTVKSSLLSPREVFLHALAVQAVHIMLLHNHPSGNSSPSSQDKEITRRILETGNLLDIPLIDHIIIGDLNYFSFKENGYL
ncbi:MAG: DNA repair protein RadC [Lachnospiraceae bacterium]|nr:DNA repair protein RadC [Lachnospiraceae bacterium]